MPQLFASYPPNENAVTRAGSFGTRVSFCLLLVVASGLGAADEVPQDDGSTRPVAIELKAGPQLFLDDYLIADQSFLTRTVNRPEKLPEPIVTGASGGDFNFQPYMTVLRDSDTGRFRLWYNVPQELQTADTFSQQTRGRIGYMESVDGIHWLRPYHVLKDPALGNGATEPIRFGASVVDRGGQFVPADERYALAFWKDDGMRVAVSPDGLDWRMLRPGTVLKHDSDINAIAWDPIRQHFLAIVSVSSKETGWGKTWPVGRRIPYESTSSDLINWEKKWPIIGAKIGAPIEQGETQFYSMSGVLARGELLVGLVKVLRDDLNATPGAAKAAMGDSDPRRRAAGLGYTVLAWTRDGRHWQRDQEPFIGNEPDPACWDHAMAWGTDQIVVGKETFVYYSGYKRGHKVARSDERQIGLARMPRDRYVAREADINLGRLITKAVILDGRKLTVNAKVVGEMWIRLLDENYAPIEGFGWTEVQGDGVDLSVHWPGDLGAPGRPVRLEFALRYAELFGFNLHS